MPKEIIEPKHLKEFFSKLSSNYGKFIVLRGYEALPSGYSNDIDVYIPKYNLARFFNAIKNIENIDTSINILDSRLGLIKCELILQKNIIPFDVLYSFNYFGLEYQDLCILSKQSEIHHSGLFCIPNIGDEVRISLLKELLHNSRVRHDKAAYLSSMIDDHSNLLEKDFFSLSDINYINSNIKNRQFNFTKTSRLIKFKLLISNIKTGIFSTIKRIFMFILIKYVLKNKYHEWITK